IYAPLFSVVVPSLLSFPRPSRALPSPIASPASVLLPLPPLRDPVSLHLPPSPRPRSHPEPVAVVPSRQAQTQSIVTRGTVEPLASATDTNRAHTTTYRRVPGPPAATPRCYATVPLHDRYRLPTLASCLRQAVDHVFPFLLSLSVVAYSLPPAPGASSPIHVLYDLGSLLDFASRLLAPFVAPHAPSARSPT
ncbi:hypothetical protein FALBO_16852, partial [Fusarium albosuccineum]